MQNNIMIKKIIALVFIILNIGAAAVVPESGETRVKFIAAGDNIVHEIMIEDARERSGRDGGYNFKDMYKHVADIIKAADISLVNVETPIAGDEFEYSGYPHFNTPKENGHALAELFNIINIANNHMVDCGETGYINHINFWESQDIMLVGVYKDAQDFERVRVYNIKDISVAFLSYTYGTNGMLLPEESGLIVPLIDKDIMERQIRYARDTADVLVIIMHWGEEDSFAPDKWQRSLAQMMADNGVDLIVGMHPHVLQEIKWVRRKDGGRMLVAYSLGNFISAQIPAHNLVGALLELDIIKKDGKISLENASIIPIVTHYNKARKGLQVYRLEDYTDKLARAHGCININEKFSLEYLNKLVTDIIAPEFINN